MKQKHMLEAFARIIIKEGHENHALVDRCDYYLRWLNGEIEDNEIKEIEEYIQNWMPKVNSKMIEKNNDIIGDEVRIEIEFNTGNDVFMDYYDIEFNRVIDNVSERIKKGYKFGSLIDSNGNKIGKFDVKIS